MPVTMGLWVAGGGFISRCIRVEAEGRRKLELSKVESMIPLPALNRRTAMELSRGSEMGVGLTAYLIPLFAGIEFGSRVSEDSVDSPRAACRLI